MINSNLLRSAGSRMRGSMGLNRVYALLSHTLSIRRTRVIRIQREVEGRML
jgi:hypothetical protein